MGSITHRPGSVADRILRDLIVNGPAEGSREVARRVGVSPHDQRLNRALQHGTDCGRILSDTWGSGTKRTNIRANPLLGICACCDQVTGYEAVLAEGRDDA